MHLPTKYMHWNNINNIYLITDYYGTVQFEHFDFPKWECVKYVVIPIINSIVTALIINDTSKLPQNTYTDNPYTKYT